MLHDVAQNINRLHRARVRHVNVINGAVEAGVGVHVTARFLHFLINATARARRRAFEQHVFEHVRKSRAQPFALVNAPRHRPRLRTDHRRAVVLAHDDDKAVFKRRKFDAGRNGRNFRIIFLSHVQEKNKLESLRSNSIHFDERNDFKRQKLLFLT